MESFTTARIFRWLPLQTTQVGGARTQLKDERRKVTTGKAKEKERDIERNMELQMSIIRSRGTHLALQFITTTCPHPAIRGPPQAGNDRTATAIARNDQPQSGGVADTARYTAVADAVVTETATAIHAADAAAIIRHRDRGNRY